MFIKKLKSLRVDFKKCGEIAFYVPQQIMDGQFYVVV